jgi:hypothetical protein
MDNFDNSPLVRTAFDNESAWTALVQAATQESPEGFAALLRVVNDRSYEGAGSEQLTRSEWDDAAVLFVADAAAQSGAEQPLLCVDLVSGAHPPDRITASAPGPSRHIRRP